MTLVVFGTPEGENQDLIARLKEEKDGKESTEVELFHSEKDFVERIQKTHPEFDDKWWVSYMIYDTRLITEEVAARDISKYRERLIELDYPFEEYNTRGGYFLSVTLPYIANCMCNHALILLIDEKVEKEIMPRIEAGDILKGYPNRQWLVPVKSPYKIDDVIAQIRDTREKERRYRAIIWGGQEGEHQEVIEKLRHQERHSIDYVTDMDKFSLGTMEDPEDPSTWYNTFVWDLSLIGGEFLDNAAEDIVDSRRFIEEEEEEDDDYDGGYSKLEGDAEDVRKGLTRARVFSDHINSYIHNPVVLIVDEELVGKIEKRVEQARQDKDGCGVIIQINKPYDQEELVRAINSIQDLYDTEYDKREKLKQEA
ncbi:MAG: hypothetical protein KAT43_06505 [Nanoarchaeota archaeon]|nr:hypothetical protein [Nanoarchaeota archaeon]